jgi:2-iminobutanoate/2-iminopropanoate deaminase
MRKHVIATSEAPSSQFYSQAVRAADFLFFSGFVGSNSQTKKVEGVTIEEQTRQAIQNCETVLTAAGARLEDVVQVVVLLRDPGDFDAFNREYSKFFPKDPPVRAVGRLGVELPNVKVSLMMRALISL